MNHKNLQYFLIPLFLLIFFINCYSSLRHKGSTADAQNHLYYGQQFFNNHLHRDQPFLDSKMPISALNAIPSLISGENDPLQATRQGRIITLLFALLLAFYVWRWSKELYGTAAGLFSLFLFCFSPNIIAHARLVTTDLYAALFLTMAVYYFRRFLLEDSWKNCVLSAVTLSLAQLAKYSCAYLYPVFIIILLIRVFIKRRNTADEETADETESEDSAEISRNYKKPLLQLLVFIAAAVLIINIGFRFDRSFTAFKDYGFRSSLFKNTQSAYSFLGAVPVPLPYAFIDGMDWVKFNEETGMGSGNIYLLGDLKLRNNRTTNHKIEGFKGYFIIAFLYKVPLALQIILAMSILLLIKNRRNLQFADNELFLLAPLLFFIFYLNFLFKAQLGFRFFLIVLPLIFILCGVLLKNWQDWSTAKKGGLAMLLLWMLLSVFSYYPHYLSYFNELSPDRKKHWKILADSNLNWSQNQWYLDQYLKKHPDAVLNPSAPSAGHLVVDSNQLTGVFYPEKYRWLRENFEPSGHIAYGYIIYQISVDEFSRLMSEPVPR